MNVEIGVKFLKINISEKSNFDKKIKLRMNVQAGLSSGFICHIKIICCILKLFINSFVRHINVPLCSNNSDDDLSRHRNDLSLAQGSVYKLIGLNKYVVTFLYE